MERAAAPGSDNQRRGGTLLHLLLHVAQELGLHQPLETLLATFPANQVQQEDADCRSHGSRRQILRELLVMPGNQNHHQQIRTDRNKEKGIVRDRQGQEPEYTKLNEIRQ